MKTADEIRRQFQDSRLEKIENQILKAAKEGKNTLILQFDYHPHYVCEKLKESGYYVSSVNDLSTWTEQIFKFYIQW